MEIKERRVTVKLGIIKGLHRYELHYDGWYVACFYADKIEVEKSIAGHMVTIFDHNLTIASLHFCRHYNAKLSYIDDNDTMITVIGYE